MAQAAAPAKQAANCAVGLAVVRAIVSPSTGTAALAAETARHDSRVKTDRFMPEEHPFPNALMVTETLTHGKWVRAERRFSTSQRRCTLLIRNGFLFTRRVDLEP